MATPHACSECEQREADVILSTTTTGDSRWLCLACLPFAVLALMELAGFPRFVLITEGDAREAGIELAGSDAGPGEAGPPDGDDEPGDDEPDDLEPDAQAAPIGPGALEQMEANEGRVTPARSPARGRKSETSEASGNGATAQAVAAPTDD